MTNCKVFLDDMMIITAIPVADFIPGTRERQLTPTIPVGQFSSILANSITIGMQPASTDGILIPIMRATSKAKDEKTGRRVAASWRLPLTAPLKAYIFHYVV